MVSPASLRRARSSTAYRIASWTSCWGFHPWTSSPDELIAYEGSCTSRSRTCRPRLDPQHLSADEGYHVDGSQAEARRAVVPTARYFCLGGQDHGGTQVFDRQPLADSLARPVNRNRSLVEQAVDGGGDEFPCARWPLPTRLHERRTTTSRPYVIA